MKRLSSVLGAVLCLAFAAPAFAVQELIKVGVTTVPIQFLLTNASNGQVGLTGQVSNITVTVCRPGTTSFVASTGTTAEVGLGYYNYTPGSAEVSATGLLTIDIEDSSAYAPTSGSAQIIAFDPNDAGFLGLSGISAANQAADTQTGLTNQGLTTSLASGLLTTNTDVPLIYTGVTALPTASSIVTALNSQTVDGSATYLQTMQYILSYMDGKATNSVSGNNLVTQYYLQNGTSTAFSNTTHYSSPPTAPAGRN